MTQVGAKGDTARELAAGINLPSEKEQLESTFRELLPTVRSTNEYNLTTANKIFIKKDFKVKKDFLNTAHEVFQSGVENVDFLKKEETASHINQWVEDKTNNKIRNLITPDILTPDTRLILVNALHFQGKWLNSFDFAATSKAPFYVTPEKTVDLDFMFNIDYFNYVDNAELDAKFIELPYKGGDLSMTIALPNKKNGLKALEARIQDVLTPQNYKNTRVQILMPKFTSESSIEFVPMLKNVTK